MTEIKAILLVPEDDDPLGLLDGGVCGARPPAVIFDTRLHTVVHMLDSGRGAATVLALVLARKGEIVPEGVDRFARVGGWEPREYCEQWVREVMSRRNDTAAAADMGTIILLDAEGKEIEG